jgi:hypothetical protein
MSPLGLDLRFFESAISPERVCLLPQPAEKQKSLLTAGYPIKTIDVLT